MMQPIRRRALSMTPMIDVVFLLLLFFLLTTQMGVTAAIPVGVAQTGESQTAQPVLLEIEAPDAIMIDGQKAALSDWQSILRGAPRALAIRPRNIDTQTLISFLDEARAQGWTNITLVEGAR